MDQTAVTTTVTGIWGVMFPVWEIADLHQVTALAGPRKDWMPLLALSEIDVVCPRTVKTIWTRCLSKLDKRLIWPRSKVRWRIRILRTGLGPPFPCPRSAAPALKRLALQNSGIGPTVWTRANNRKRVQP